MIAHSPTPTESTSGYPMRAQIGHEWHSPIIPPAGGIHPLGATGTGVGERCLP